MIEINENVIISLARKYHIKELSFFGSVLREDFTENSDIDILIEFEIALGKKIDLIEKGGLRNPYRRENILKNSRVIYAA